MTRDVLLRAFRWLRLRVLRWETAAALAALVLFLLAARWTLAPIFTEKDTFGIHDWDAHTAHRYIPLLSLLRYHEGPWWSPWFCGGYPSWGYGESSPNVVSIFFPVYLFASLPTALRIEVVGTTLLGGIGAGMLAGRYTRSWALRLFVAVLFALNGRFALQATSGHAWHLQYAYVPWALYFVDRALTGRMQNAFVAGIFLALMAYAGGIYPLPHAALLTVGLCVLRAGIDRSARPLGVLVVAGASSFALAAPKLLPVLDTMRRAPRAIDSIETMDPRQAWLMAADPDQGFGRAPAGAGPLPYGWHEFGIYVGGAVVLALAFGLILRGDRRAAVWKVLGLLLLVLAFGAFHEDAPWALLHKMPVFSSQHVPSRFMYPAILALGVAFAATVGQRIERLLRRRPWLDLLFLVPVGLVAADISHVSSNILTDAFSQVRPEITAGTFHHERRAPIDYARPDWATPAYLATLANVGIVECWTVPNDFPRGAIVRGAPEYRGEAYVVNGTGDATILDWTPNSVTVDVKNASPGAVLVYNMNWDPSWRANGVPALEWQHAVGTRLSQGHETVVFRYRPRTLPAGIVLCLTAIVAMLLLRRRAAAKGRPPPRAVTSA